MAIVCGLNAAEAWKIYQYGPDHPLSKKILKHKIRDSSLKKLKKKEQEKMMKKLFLEGYSKNGNSYEKADNQGRMLGSAGLPGGENLRMQISTGKSVQVTYRMEIPAGFLGLKWKIKATGKAVPLRPVGWIRKVKSSRDAVEEVRQ